MIPNYRIRLTYDLKDYVRRQGAANLTQPHPIIADYHYYCIKQVDHDRPVEYELYHVIVIADVKASPYNVVWTNFHLTKFSYR